MSYQDHTRMLNILASALNGQHNFSLKLFVQKSLMVNANLSIGTF